MTKKQKKAIRSIFIAGILYTLLLILEHSGVLAAVFSRWYLSLLLYLVPYLIVGWQVLRKAFSGIRNRQVFDESFLMTIATIGAFGARENSEAVAVMLFYQIGEFFQSYAVGKSRKSIRDLMDIAPEYANVIREDGSVETVDPDEVAIGDILLVRPGDRIPVDGVVTEGESLLHTAALTGESVPRSIYPDSQIFSGCINGDGLLKMRASKCYDDSTVARILELVETASEKKSRTEQFITRFARYYTPVVVIGALLLALIPPLFTGHWMTWIIRACTFLVISCPCALVISVPLAFFGGVGAASRMGVLVKGSNYLELLARLDTLVTDKTGTLTSGVFEVTDYILPDASPAGDPADNPVDDPEDGARLTELLETAALAEGSSTHPIAVSICEAYRKHCSGSETGWISSGSENAFSYNNGAASQASPDGFSSDAGAAIFFENEGKRTRITRAENITGRGITAEIDGKIVLAGSRLLMDEYGVSVPADPAFDSSATVVHVAKENKWLGAILISDRIKEGVPESIEALRSNSVRRIIMLTGDRREVGDEVAAAAGLDAAYSELLPQDKVEKVEMLLKEMEHTDGILGYIGDGINDAPVLSRSDVGIAMGSMGSDAAIEAADVVVMDDDLRKIPAVMGIARKTVGISRQNIVFALTVKVLILILGALGLAGMWAAVFADVGVAVLCILNSMRLLR